MSKGLVTLERLDAGYEHPYAVQTSPRSHEQRPVVRAAKGDIGGLLRKGQRTQVFRLRSYHPNAPATRNV